MIKYPLIVQEGKSSHLPIPNKENCPRIFLPSDLRIVRHSRKEGGKAMALVATLKTRNWSDAAMDGWRTHYFAKRAQLLSPLHSGNCNKIIPISHFWRICCVKRALHGEAIRKSYENNVCFKHSDRYRRTCRPRRVLRPLSSEGSSMTIQRSLPKTGSPTA